MIIANATLRGREGTWNIHIHNGNFSSIVASPADRRDSSSDAESFDAAGRLAVARGE